MQENNTQEKYIQEDEIDLKELLVTLAKGKKTIAITVLVFGVLSVVYALLATPQYDTSTKVIYESAEGSGGAGGQLGALAAMAGMGFGAGSSDISSYLQDILNSSSFLEPILKKEWQIEENDTTKMTFFEHWKVEPDSTKENWERILLQSSIEGLQKMIAYSVDKKTGIITLTTSAQTPYLSYQLNNYVVDELNRVILTKLNTKSSVNREFIEQNMINAKKELEKSENALKMFKQRNAISMSPNLILEEARLMREVEVEQKVYLTLRQQYELAKIDEQKDIPVISVIDEAKIPYLKAKPQKKKIVLMAGVGGVFVGIFLVFIIDFYRKNKEAVLEIIKA